jgi:antitoxin FitA
LHCNHAIVAVSICRTCPSWKFPMGSMTIRNIDDEFKARLRVQAARNGVSMESEARRILREGVRPPRPKLSDEEREAKIQRILALGRKPAEPFDLKAESDALWDYMEK